MAFDRHGESVWSLDVSWYNWMGMRMSCIMAK